MKIGKKGFMILSASSLLLGGLGFVGAQTRSGGALDAAQTQGAARPSEAAAQRPRSFGNSFG